MTRLRALLAWWIPVPQAVIKTGRDALAQLDAIDTGDVS